MKHVFAPFRRGEHEPAFRPRFRACEPSMSAGRYNRSEHEGRAFNRGTPSPSEPPGGRGCCIAGSGWKRPRHGGSMKTDLHPASLALAAAGIAVIGFGVGTASAQAPVPPNPYRWDQSWVPKLPGGRTWGSSAGVDVDRDGNIYVAERCGGNPLGCE